MCKVVLKKCYSLHAGKMEQVSDRTVIVVYINFVLNMQHWRRRTIKQPWGWGGALFQHTLE